VSGLERTAELARFLGSDNLQLGPARAIGEELIDEVTQLRARIEELETQLQTSIERTKEAWIKEDLAQKSKDVAYTERNKLVAFLARLYPSGRSRTEIDGWDPEWHQVVYIDTPRGQLSWHYHDKDAELFDGLPEYRGTGWDGHTTAEKYMVLWELGEHPPSFETEFQKVIVDHIGDTFDACQGLVKYGIEESDRYWELAERIMREYGEATNQPVRRLEPGAVAGKEGA
jgi:hypothetical protein